jgi:hypothetical protein
MCDAILHFNEIKWKLVEMKFTLFMLAGIDVNEKYILSLNFELLKADGYDSVILVCDVV